MLQTLGLLAIAIGCSSPATSPAVIPTPDPAPPSPAAPPLPGPLAGPGEPWSGSPFKDRMHEQFAAATDAVYGVILGDLDEVHARAGELVALEPPPGLPEDWRPAYDAMKAAARSAQSAATVDEAADAVLAVGRGCAGCHAVHRGPAPSVGEVLASTGSDGAAMDQHSYGAYLMWLGLFLPAPDVFAEGLKQLAHEGSIPEVDKELRPLEEQIHAQAARAGAATDDAARAAAFADMLRTCAACHAAAGAKIPR